MIRIISDIFNNVLLHYEINKVYNNMACGDYGMLESFFKDKNLHVKLFYLGCSIIPLEDLHFIFKVKKKKVKQVNIIRAIV